MCKTAGLGYVQIQDMGNFQQNALFCKKLQQICPNITTADNSILNLDWLLAPFALSTCSGTEPTVTTGICIYADNKTQHMLLKWT